MDPVSQRQSPTPIAQCSACRGYFRVASVPPYNVIHTPEGKHLHAITREEVQPWTEEETP